MWLQLLLIFWAFILFLHYESKGDTAIIRHKYVNWLIFMLIMQSGLRHIAVGPDTYAYSLLFEDAERMSWSEVFRNFYDVYVLKEGKDAGYVLLEKVFQFFIPSYRLFLIFIATFFFIPLYRLIERHLFSLGLLFLSFCIYQSLFYSFFSVTGLRQVIATVATITGISLIEKRRLKSFIIVILLASFIHKSVLLFLPFYFIAKYSRPKLLMSIVLCAMPILFVTARFMVGFMVSFAASDSYSGYAESSSQTGGAVNFALFLILTSVCILFALWKNPDKIPNWIVNAISLALFFTPLTWVDPSLMRVVQYFSIFLILGLPLAFYYLHVPRSIYRLVCVCFCLLLLFTIISRSNDYAFYWQEMRLGSNYF